MAPVVLQYGRNSIGLISDQFQPDDVPPFVMLYGPPGVGKSGAVAEAFPDSLYVQTDKGVLRYAKALADKYPHRFPRGIPKNRVTLDEDLVRYYAQNSQTPLMPFCVAFQTVIQSIVMGAAQGLIPESAIVWDEASTILGNIYQEMLADPYEMRRGKSKAVNPFAVRDAFIAMVSQFIALPRLINKAVIMISHSQPCRMFDDNDPINHGKVKFPGGPKMPPGLGDQMIALCAQASVVLELVATEGGSSAPPPMGPPAAATVSDAQGVIVAAPPPLPSLTNAGPTPPISEVSPRWILTELSPYQFRKFRGLVPPAVQMTASYTLRHLLVDGGFKI